jgi:hypothetical protein
LKSSDRGYFFSAPGALQGKIDGISCTLQRQADGYLWESGTLKVSLDKDYFGQKGGVQDPVRKGRSAWRMAAEMAVWFDGARGLRLLI